MAEVIEAYVLVDNAGASERVLVRDGEVVTGERYLGKRIDVLRPLLGSVLKIGGATNGKIDKARMKHARILAKIAGEVAETYGRSGNS